MSVENISNSQELLLQEEYYSELEKRSAVRENILDKVGYIPFIGRGAGYVYAFYSYGCTIKDLGRLFYHATANLLEPSKENQFLVNKSISYLVYDSYLVSRANRYTTPWGFLKMIALDGLSGRYLYASQVQGSSGMWPLEARKSIQNEENSFDSEALERSSFEKENRVYDWIPGVSTAKGIGFAAYNICLLVCDATLSIFYQLNSYLASDGVEKATLQYRVQRYKEMVTHDFYSTVRNVIAAIPLLGNITTFAYDNAIGRFEYDVERRVFLGLVNPK